VAFKRAGYGVAARLSLRPAAASAARVPRFHSRTNVAIGRALSGIEIVALPAPWWAGALGRLNRGGSGSAAGVVRDAPGRNPPPGCEESCRAGDRLLEPQAVGIVVSSSGAAGQPTVGQRTPGSKRSFPSRVWDGGRPRSTAGHSPGGKTQRSRPGPQTVRDRRTRIQPRGQLRGTRVGGAACRKTGSGRGDHLPGRRTRG